MKVFQLILRLLPNIGNWDIFIQNAFWLMIHSWEFVNVEINRTLRLFFIRTKSFYVQKMNQLFSGFDVFKLSYYFCGYWRSSLASNDVYNKTFVLLSLLMLKIFGDLNWRVCLEDLLMHFLFVLCGDFLLSELFSF